MSDVLIAKTGRETGTRPSRRNRRSGKVPAVLYGLGMEPVSLTVDWPELRRVLTAGGLTAPVRLRVEGTEHLTIVRDLQRHPIRRDVLHVDFLAVDPDVSVTVDVPFVLDDPEDKGLVQLVVHAVALTAKPNDMPAEVVIPVSLAGDAGEVRLREIALPAGTTTDADLDLVIAVSSAGARAGEAAEEEEAEGDAAAEADGEPDAGGEGGDAADDEAG
jgi:large subunit ribosomal protein L25